MASTSASSRVISASSDSAKGQASSMVTARTIGSLRERRTTLARASVDGARADASRRQLRDERFATDGRDSSPPSATCIWNPRFVASAKIGHPVCPATSRGVAVGGRRARGGGIGALRDAPRN